MIIRKLYFFKLYHFCHAKIQYIKSNNRFLEYGFEKKNFYKELTFRY